MKIFPPYLGFVIVLFGAFPLAHADVPSSDFGHMAAIGMPALSPNGRYVAAALNTGEFPAVVVTEFGNTELTTILRLEDQRDRIESILWANTDRLLVTVLSARLIRGRPFEYLKMYALDKDGSQLKEITSVVSSRFEGDPVDTFAVAQLGSRVSRVVPKGARILSLLFDDPNRIVVELFDMRARSYFVYKLNIYDNDIEKLLIGQKNSRRWVIDANQEISLSYSFDDQKKSVIHEYRDFYSGKWTEYRIDPYSERETFVPLLVSDGRALVMSNHQTGLESLWNYDYEAQQFVEPVFASEQYDLSEVIWDSDLHRIVGAEYADNKRTQVFFDEKYVAALQLAKAMLPAFDVTIASMSRDASRIMIRASRSDSPPKYIWADINNQVAGPWFSEYPELESVALHGTKAITFGASDGTVLSGYLTMPDPDAVVRPAVVVYAHDGPQQRATSDFDPMVQLLVNRGIAVLQINHRGSAGFGLDFQEAGYRQWGERMQQDIYDGLDWLAAQDMVDADRACVLGTGYGGYVALTAAHPTLERFRCVVSVNGITDLRKHLLDTPFYGYAWHRNVLSLGDPEDRQDIDRLDRLSPVSFADRVEIPLLLIHSEFDKEVALEQYSDFRSKARKASARKRFEFMQLDAGTHDLENNTNRVRTFEAVDRFLRRHLN